MTPSSETTIIFELKSGKDLMRCAVRCPGCRSGLFLADIKERPISRVACKTCGETYTFQSSLLVPLKHLSKNGT